MRLKATTTGEFVEKCAEKKIYWWKKKKEKEIINWKTFLLSRCAYLDTQRYADNKYARFVKKAWTLTTTLDS